MFTVIVYLLNILLSIVLCQYGNIFYDNATYIAYELNHIYLVFLWGLTTVYGLYISSKKIWNRNHYPYKKWMHNLSCILLVVSALIPYSKQEIWTNDFHVWMIVIALVLFYIQWFSFFLTNRKETTLEKWFLFHTCINISILLFLGHVTLFNEIYFALSMNIILRDPINRFHTKRKPS